MEWCLYLWPNKVREGGCFLLESDDSTDRKLNWSLVHLPHEGLIVNHVHFCCGSLSHMFSVNSPSANTNERLYEITSNLNKTSFSCLPPIRDDQLECTCKPAIIILYISWAAMTHPAVDLCIRAAWCCSKKSAHGAILQASSQKHHVVTLRQKCPPVSHSPEAKCSLTLLQRVVQHSRSSRGQLGRLVHHSPAHVAWSENSPGTGSVESAWVNIMVDERNQLLKLLTLPALL